MVSQSALLLVLLAVATCSGVVQAASVVSTSTPTSSNVQSSAFPSTVIPIASIALSSSSSDVSRSAINSATASSSSHPSPTSIPIQPRVLIDPVGEVVVEEGHNITLTCTSNVKGATLLLVKANVFSSSSLVARAEGVDLSHTFFFVRGSDVGRYWCTLQSRVATSEDVELVVTAHRPMFKLQGVSVHWIAGTRVNISWAVPSLPPWRSILGYKLNWDRVWPSPIALLSVGAETSSVELDVDFTGVVYISVWAFGRGGDGPPVVLNVTIPMASTSTPTTTITSPPSLPLRVWFDPYEATVAVGSNVTITCRSNQWARLVIAYELSPVLATSVGTSAVYHLVHVQEAHAGVIYCIGSVGTAHHIAAFYLTVWTVSINVGFDPTEYRVREDEGSVTLRLVADQVALAPCNVNITLIDINATFADDYLTESGSREMMATIAAGTKEAFIEVEIIKGLFLEENEQFKASILGIFIPGDPSDSVQVGANSEATVTILDNEPEISVSFSPVVYNFSEADGVATLTLVASTPAQVDYDVYVDTRDGTALSPDDYTGGRYTATFAAGSTSAQVNISIDDGCFDGLGAETFFGDLVISADAMAKGVRVGSGTVATVNIEDNEPAPVVNFDPTTYEVLESAGFLTSTIVSSAPACEDYDVTVATRDGSATYPDDYLGGEFTVTFGNGSTTAQVTIPVTNDMDGADECDEDFNAQISIPEEAAANSVVAGPNNTANVVIKDDEPFFIDFVSPDTDVYESERVYQFCLTHNRTCPDPFSVPVINMQSGDDPADASDYRSGPYHVSFAEGEKIACAEIPVTEDNLEEPDEMFSLQIMPDPEGVPNIMPGPNAGTQVTIKSVDGDPMFVAPVSLPKRAVIELFGQENTELAICYEVHGAENKIYNLVSDMCLSVNAHLTLASNPKVGNIMSRIGVMAMDNEGKCNQIEADLYQRTLVHNGQAMEGRKQHKGILLTKMRDRARISVPNCKGQSIVFWVIYHYHNGADMIKFTIADGHGLMPESHGLMGQFWNTPVEVVKLQKDKKLEAGEEFKVVVHSSFSGPRDFTGEYYPITWDFQRSPCLYAGSENGSPVIEGRYTDYEVKSLFDPAFSYSQFSKDHCGKLPKPEAGTTIAHVL